MISIQKATDLISISLENVLKHRLKDEKAQSIARNWNKNILIDIKQFYPVTVIFNQDTISFTLEEETRYDLKIGMSLDHMLDMAMGRLNPVIAFLTRRLRIKGIFKIGTLLNFYKIFFMGMNQVMATTNTNYFEVYKEVR